MAMDLQDWLWRLDCIQEEMQRRAPHVHVVFSLRVDLAEGARTKCNTFPLEHGKVVERFEDPVPKFQDPDTGLLWFDLGHKGFRFVVCWQDLVLYESPPSEEIPENELPAFADEALGWNTWYYIEASGEQETSVEVQGRHIRRGAGRLCHAAGKVCHLAPRPVLDKVGDLSFIAERGWPTAILYLAMKQAHPLLEAWGTVTIDDSIPDDGWNDFDPFEVAKDLVIELRPSDLSTATAYAFDVLRHIARMGDWPTGREGERLEARKAKPRYRPPSCPQCGGKVMTTSTRKDIRHLKCRKCGHTWTVTREPV